MEAILASGSADTDVLPPNLKYGMDPTGSFVLSKNERTVFALGSSYSPAGVKMIQIPFGSTQEWLVPESVVFSALVTNEHASRGLWSASPDVNCLFERIDIRLGGNLIESVTESARCNEVPLRRCTSHRPPIGRAWKVPVISRRSHPFIV